MFVIVLGIERVLIDLELKNLEEARVFQDRDLSKITDGFSTPGSVAQVGKFFGNSWNFNLTWAQDYSSIVLVL